MGGKRTLKSSYTDRSQFIVAESGGGRAGGWVSERADVATDFSRAFQKQAGYADATGDRSGWRQYEEQRSSRIHRPAFRVTQ